MLPKSSSSACIAVYIPREFVLKMLNKTRNTPEHCKQKRISCKQTFDEKCENAKHPWRKRGLHVQKEKNGFWLFNACCYFYINSFRFVYFAPFIVISDIFTYFSRLFALNISISSKLARNVFFILYVCAVVFISNVISFTCSAHEVIT